MLVIMQPLLVYNATFAPLQATQPLQAIMQPLHTMQPLQAFICSLAGKKAVQAAAGAFHTVLVLEDGTVMAFGHNEDGQTTVPDDDASVMLLVGGRS